MEFRDLNRQYKEMKSEIDLSIKKVIERGHFVLGSEVEELENDLLDYTESKFCISCANGTDALILSLMSWNIGPGDCVFVSDFSYVASASCVSIRGAEPVFVDIDLHTYTMNPKALEASIIRVINEGRLNPRAIIPVDLFGLPANYPEILRIAEKYELKVLEDAAQGFGGAIGKRKACTFGDISITSFFPSKPIGCYGDGGAVFTNDESVAELIWSLRGQGRTRSNKYENTRIGLNSRLDTLQAAILLVKLKKFREYELETINCAANLYNHLLDGIVLTPQVPENYLSSWAQYTIALRDRSTRDILKLELEKNGIPAMIYYPIPLHQQKAFGELGKEEYFIENSIKASQCVLSLPIHPYIKEEEIQFIANTINKVLRD